MSKRAKKDRPGKFYLRCGTATEIRYSQSAFIASWDFLEKLIHRPGGWAQLDHVVFASERGFRSANNLDRETKLETVWRLLFFMGAIKRIPPEFR